MQLAELTAIGRWWLLCVCVFFLTQCQRGQEQSSQARHDHKSVCERIESDRHVFCSFKYPVDVSTLNVRSPYDGYAACEVGGLLAVLHARSTFTSNGGPEPVASEHTQGKYQVTPRKVFSFLDSVELKDGQKACRF